MPELEPDGGAVLAASETGVERDLLVALRRRLASALDDPRTQPRDLSAITARLREVSKDLAALDVQEGGDDLGEAAATPDAEFDPEAL